MEFIRRNLDRIFLIILLIVLFCSLVFYVFDTLKNKDTLSEAKKIDEIEQYNYSLHEDDSDLYRAYFAKLKDLLKEENVNYDEYAKIISSLFVIDFYTLDNKVTNMDVGGIQYLYSDIKDNFILKASDTIYKNVKSNIYGDRNQELPIVSEVSTEILKTSFQYGSLKDDNAYNINVLINYEKDLGYPNEVKLTIVHVDNKLVIVEVK